MIAASQSHGAVAAERVTPPPPAALRSSGRLEGIEIIPPPLSTPEKLARRMIPQPPSPTLVAALLADDLAAAPASDPPRLPEIAGRTLFPLPETGDSGAEAPGLRAIEGSGAGSASAGPLSYAAAPTLWVVPNLAAGGSPALAANAPPPGPSTATAALYAIVADGREPGAELDRRA